VSVSACACLIFFFGADSREEPSEASRWEAMLAAPVDTTRDDWQAAYIRFRDNHRDAEAADAVRACARGNPDNPNALMAAALVERDTERLDEAEAIFSNLIERNPQSSGALWNLGRLALRKGDIDGAASYFERSREAAPSAWQPIYALSQVRRQQGRVPEAQKLWTEAKKLGAGKISERSGMGSLRLDVGLLMSEMEWD
jgi:tetratricopeptide (TPR) repeat protein